MSKLVLPKHVAIIMDGNGRWAKRRFLPRIFGHQTAISRVKELVTYASDLHIQALTLFAFSSENWNRPPSEVSFLMGLITGKLRDEIFELHEKQVRFQVWGSREGLSSDILNIIEHAETLTAANTGLNLNIAFNYGGRAELLQAAQTFARWVKIGQAEPEELTEDRLETLLYSKEAPPLDLLIRTSGESRLSNFMLWQCAYAELYFVETYFPDFTPKEFDKALAWYQTRERRYGKTSEQLHGQA